MKKAMLKILALTMTMAMAVGGLAGCGKKEEKTKDGYAKEINFITWDSQYSEQVFKDFEKKYGIHVNVTYINNTDELLSKMLNGGADYDLIDIESAYVESFVKNDLVQKLDKEQIPNSKNFYKECLGVVGDEKNEYTIPAFGKGFTTIIYNKETCPIKITKFSDLANPKLKNQICMVNSTISLFGMALQSLGYSAGTNNEKEIKEAADILTKIKPNVKTFVGSSGENQMLKGECSVGFLWDYTLLMQDKKNWDKFAIADLETGSESFMETLAIPKETEKTKEAHLLMNYLSEPEVQAVSIQEWGDMPCMDCEKYLPDGYMDNPAFNLPSKFKKAMWMAPVNDKQIELMDKYYTKFMSEK